MFAIFNIETDIQLKECIYVKAIKTEGILETQELEQALLY